MFYNSKTIVPVVNQYESSSNQPYFSLDFTFIEKDRRLLGIELASYKGWVDFNASAEKDADKEAQTY